MNSWMLSVSRRMGDRRAILGILESEEEEESESRGVELSVYQGTLVYSQGIEALNI
jgi:hypothetical protein